MMRSVLSVCVMFALLLQGLNAQLKVRLVDGTAPWNGRLEVLYDGIWSPVCSNSFRKQETQVVCRMLGFNTKQVYTGSLYTNSMRSNKIKFNNLRCTGEESSLEKCSYTGIRTGIRCPYAIAVTCNSQNIQLRLSVIRPNRHQAEIDIGLGHWWSLCVESNNTARVVCRQLGLPWLGAMTFFNKNVGFRGDFSSCLGNETSIAECQPEMSSDKHCWDYNITCSNCVVNIHTTSRTYPLMEETNATLECASNEQSHVIKYTWPENAGGFPDGSSLIITRVTREHHGRRVRCEAMYSNGDVVSSDILQLQVYYRRVIRITRSDNQGQPLSTYSEVIKGHNQTFVCDADSNPPPASITWSGKVSSTTGELHIIAAQQTTHEDIYTCTVVTGTHGDDERLPLRAFSQITLIVKGIITHT